MRSFVFILAAASFFICGCGGRTNLERASKQLKQGMDRGRVRAVFSGFRLSDDKTNAVDILSPTKRFRKDPCGASIMQFDTNQRVALLGPLPEWCTVYFDTNGVIIAYKYCYMN